MTSSSRAGLRVLSGWALALTTAACTAGGSDAHSSPEHVSSEYCQAAAVLEVGRGLPTPEKRLRTLERMEASAPEPWRPVLRAAIASVRSGHDMESSWDVPVATLLRSTESACDLNLPELDPR